MAIILGVNTIIYTNFCLIKEIAMASKGRKNARQVHSSTFGQHYENLKRRAAPGATKPTKLCSLGRVLNH